MRACIQSTFQNDTKQECILNNNDPNVLDKIEISRIGSIMLNKMIIYVL